jgi:hypothetical protein
LLDEPENQFSVIKTVNERGKRYQKTVKRMRMKRKRIVMRR